MSTHSPKHAPDVPYAQSELRSIPGLETIVSEPYRAVLDAIENAAVVIDSDNTIRLTNQRFLQMTGLLHTEVENTAKWTEFIDIEDVEDLNEYLRTDSNVLIDTSTAADLKFVGIDEARPRVQISIRKIPETTLRVVVFIDLTVVEETRIRLQESEQRYLMLAQAAHEMILVADKEGNISMVNQAALKAVGIETLEGKWKNLYSWIDKSDHLELEFLLEKSMSDDLNGGVVEINIVTMDNLYTPIEASAVSVRKEEGESDILVIARDISDRKRVESRLHEERVRLEQVLESADAFIAFSDAEGRYTLVNQRFASALNHKPEEIIGKRGEQFLSSSVLNSISLRLKEALSGQQVSFEEYLVMPGVGKARWYSGTHNPIFDMHGKLRGLVTVILDITEQKNANEIRLETERLDLARKLARTVAHEFRQPLAALRLVSEIATMNNWESEFMSRNRDKIPAQVDRLDNLVSRLLSITDLQSKPYIHNTEIFDLETSIATVNTPKQM
ncbi:sporulation kinase E [bacterium BMS3Bbin04]|nr:sporulation kinase E [bacterium BMS3Bbin04]